LSYTDWNTFNNKVSTLGSYSDPSWITSLAGSKISGSVGWADVASAITWSGVSGTPTTLSGYGITNAYTKTEVEDWIQTRQHSFTTSSPLTYDVTGEAHFLGIAQATTNTSGYLSYTDWNNFNNKLSSESDPDWNSSKPAYATNLTISGTTIYLKNAAGTTLASVALPTTTLTVVTDLNDSDQNGQADRYKTRQITVLSAGTESGWLTIPAN
jgi:hypothetical protein